MLNIVLLGGTGFVGSAIIRKIGEKKFQDVTVRALIRGDAGRINSANVKTIEGNLPDRIPEELFPEEPHVVVHFATKQIDHDDSGFYDANVEGTKRLIEALPKSTKGIIYGSSMSVYGQGQQVDVTEQQPVKPETELAETRVEAEKIILDAAKSSGRTGFVLRPRFMLGNGDQYTLKGFKTMVQKGIVVGSGKQSYSIIDVDDYAEIIISLAQSVMKRDEKNEPLSCPLNIGYEKPVSLDYILHEICNDNGSKFPTKKIPVFKILPAILRALPISAAASFATKLELVGLSHYGNVKALTNEIGTEITEKKSSKVFSKILENSYN